MSCIALQVDAEEAKRIESDDGVRYVNYPLNDVLAELAKAAGCQYFTNVALKNKDEYLLTGHIKNGDSIEQFHEIAFMYGCEGFRNGDTLYCITEEQLAKMPRDKFLWKVRYIEEKDIPLAIKKLEECFTAIDSKVEYLEDRKVIQIQGRITEVAKAEKLLDVLDAPEKNEETKE